MTNADYIRNMNDEELACFLDEVQRQECEALHEMRPDGSLKFYSCQYGWRLWLKEEVRRWRSNAQRVPVDLLQLRCENGRGK